MMKTIISSLCSLFLFVNSSFAQIWVWTPVAEMPEKVSNNAVTAFTYQGEARVFSFSGIDETKRYTGIHNSCFKYDLKTENWTQIADLPDPRGRIAAGASVVKDKIYIIGGYEVFASGGEKSIEKVHVYDPINDTFLEDAAPIPLPIDDHVQAVYKDSLIYVVSGWSDTKNVPNVQIYNPALDEWQAGTAVPDLPEYQVFGGSGTIVGDTLYYIGGAKFTNNNFTLGNHFRKGYIHPENPSQIDWELVNTDEALGYRMAATELNNQPLWIGGSGVAYNYDGIAYNGSGGVPPFNRLLRYLPNENRFLEELDVSFPVMDLRGVGKIRDGLYYIVGGMEESQAVSSKCYALEYFDLSSGLENKGLSPIRFFPNPASDYVYLEDLSAGQLLVFAANGTMIKRVLLSGAAQEKVELPQESGLYFLLFVGEEGKERAVALVFRD